MKEGPAKKEILETTNFMHNCKVTYYGQYVIICMKTLE